MKKINTRSKKLRVIYSGIIIFIVLAILVVNFGNKNLLTELGVLKISDGDKTGKPEPNNTQGVVPKEEVKIGFVTDAHCYASNSKKTGYEWELNWRCTVPLERFVSKMNDDFKPDFVVQGGDLVDGRDKRIKETFIEAQRIYEKVNVPYYHLLGNHEMKEITVEQWKELVGYKRAYYYFDLKGYRFIMLDGNYRPTNDGGIEHTKDGSLYYPGYVGGEQLEWLKRVLAGANELGLTNVVFVHQPPVGNDTRDVTRLFKNGKEIQKIFTKNNVEAVFSGHIERMCNTEVSGVEYFVLQGFWKGNKDLLREFQYRNGGTFSQIILSPDGDIKVEMFYLEEKEQPYRSIIVDKDSGNCQNGEKLIQEINANDEDDEADEEPISD